MDKSRILENISNLLLENKIEEARATIQNEYPHKHQVKIQNINFKDITKRVAE